MLHPAVESAGKSRKTKKSYWIISMHIFIDESGVFSTEPNRPAWSTVGGVAIPDVSLDEVRVSLEKLKVAHGIGINEEFKTNRPDCTSNPYQEFFEIVG